MILDLKYLTRLVLSDYERSAISKSIRDNSAEKKRKNETKMEMKELIEKVIKDYIIGPELLQKIETAQKDFKKVIRTHYSISVYKTGFDGVEKAVEKFKLENYKDCYYYCGYISFDYSTKFPITSKLTDSTITEKLLVECNVPKAIIDRIRELQTNFYMLDIKLDHLLDDLSSERYGRMTELGVFKNWGDIYKYNKDWYNLLVENYAPRRQDEVEEMKLIDDAASVKDNMINTTARLYELAKHCNIIK